MAIDLSSARRKVESFMTETADVYLPDPVHSPAAVIDPVTLQLMVPVATPLLRDVACKIKDVTSTSRGHGAGDSEGGNMLLLVVTKIDFPIDEIPDAGLPEGCLIVCKSSLRMPQMVGAQYQMRQSVLKTFGIQYSVLADRRKQVDP